MNGTWPPGTSGNGTCLLPVSGSETKLVSGSETKLVSGGETKLVLGGETKLVSGGETKQVLGSETKQVLKQKAAETPTDAVITAKISKKYKNSEQNSLEFSRKRCIIIIKELLNPSS